MVGVVSGQALSPAPHRRGRWRSTAPCAGEDAPSHDATTKISSNRPGSLSVAEQPPLGGAGPKSRLAYPDHRRHELALMLGRDQVGVPTTTGPESPSGLESDIRIRPNDDVAGPCWRCRQTARCGSMRQLQPSMPAATRKVTVSPKESATTPHAAPRRLAHRRAPSGRRTTRARTQRGKKSCSNVLTVASTPTHAMPAGIRTMTTTTVECTKITTTRAQANTPPISPMRTFTDSRARTFDSTDAPAIAPTPRAPSRRPYPPDRVRGVGSRRGGAAPRARSPGQERAPPGAKSGGRPAHSGRIDRRPEAPTRIARGSAGSCRGSAATGRQRGRRRGTSRHRGQRPPPPLCR